MPSAGLRQTGDDEQPPAVSQLGLWAARILVGLGWVGLLVGALGLVARFVHTTWQPPIVVAAFFPYTAAVALAGTILLLVRTVWLGVAAGAVLLVISVALQVPLYLPTPTPTRGVTLIVLQANVRRATPTRPAW
jgi:hypothetical protein